jgi:hypothetical protein
MDLKLLDGAILWSGQLDQTRAPVALVTSSRFTMASVAALAAQPWPAVSPCRGSRPSAGQICVLRRAANFLCSGDIAVALIGTALALQLKQPHARSITLGIETVHGLNLVIEDRQGSVELGSGRRRSLRISQGRGSGRAIAADRRVDLGELSRDQLTLGSSDIVGRSGRRHEMDTLPVEGIHKARLRATSSSSANRAFVA